MQRVQRLSPALLGVVFFLIFSLVAQPCGSQNPPGFPGPRGFADQVLYLDRDAVGIFGTRGFAIDPGTDEVYVAIESRIYRVDPGGQRVLVDELGPGQEVGLLVRPAGSPEIFFTSLDGGTVYRRDLQTGTTQTSKGPRFGFDLAVTDAGQVLISANPFFPNLPNSSIWFADPGSAPREVVQLSGPSGPLLVDPDGNLLYATQHPNFPPPPGSTRILRFTRDKLAQTLAGGAPLTEAV